MHKHYSLYFCHENFCEDKKIYCLFIDFDGKNVLLYKDKCYNLFKIIKKELYILKTNSKTGAEDLCFRPVTTSCRTLPEPQMPNKNKCINMNYYKKKREARLHDNDNKNSTECFTGITYYLLTEVLFKITIF